LKNSLVVIDCGCFQTFVERENFFGKDTGKFLAKILAKILLGVSNVCNVYNCLTNYNFEVKIKYLNYETLVEYLERRHIYSIQRIVI